MAFTFTEKPTSRARQYTPNDRKRTLEYTAAGSVNDNFVYAMAIAGSPSILDGLFRESVSLSAQGSELFDVTVSYGSRKSEVGEYRLSFDTTGGTLHIRTSKETVASFPAGAPDHQQAIGVEGDNVAGVDIVIPALKLTVTFKHPAGVITLPRIKQLARLTGKTNDDVWLTFERGEVLFLGATGSENPGVEAEVSYSFACSENLPAHDIGAIANVTKRGHEALWITFEPAVDGGNPVRRPIHAYVERVYDEEDFRAQLGFG